MTTLACKKGWGVGEQFCKIKVAITKQMLSPLTTQLTEMPAILIPGLFYVVQTLKKGSTDQEKIEFLKEAHLMRYQAVLK